MPRPAILIADDDPIFAALAAASLSRAGYETVIAADGLEALTRLEAQAFCLALVDLDMPRIDGFRLIALVRGRRELDRLAIMVTTSSHRRTDHCEALALGADAVEMKPLDWNRLGACVEGVLLRRGSRPGGDIRSAPCEAGLLSGPAA